MKKRIIICADGTWNKPEKNIKEDFPTNVLKLARAIKPVGSDNVPQQVFYDWGVGSYYDKGVGGITGKGVQKNIMDDYRYIVQNYSPGDELYLFGFSRGSYTIRSLCGLINNCGILKRDDANLIARAFRLYKRSGGKFKPKGPEAITFRKQHAHPDMKIKFVGVWDTVGAMGIPISFLGLFEGKDEFYDTKLGPNIETTRHALAIDEHRADFDPTIWKARQDMNLKQVWFAGAHCDIGGSYKPDTDGTVLSDCALKWMIQEATTSGLTVESHLTGDLQPNIRAKVHNSRITFYKLKKKYLRPIDHKESAVLIHQSVKDRWDQDDNYRPENLKKYIKEVTWDGVTIES